VIFVQLILNNFDDKHFSSLVIEQKQWREKKRINTHVSIRDRVVSKVVKK